MYKVIVNLLKEEKRLEECDPSQGLFFVFDTEDNMVGVILYDINTDSYYVETLSDGYKVYRSCSDNIYKTIKEFLNKFPKTVIKYSPTKTLVDCK